MFEGRKSQCEAVGEARSEASEEMGNGCGEADRHSVSIEVNEIGTGITDLTNAVKVCFVHDL
jgi:hypothetical protein